MLDDVECPYCGKPQEINHDDGYGYDEGEVYSQECGGCGKVFGFTTTISFYHDAYKADCLNDGEHDMQPVISFPRYWPNWKRCSMCGHEERGEFCKEKESD